MMSACVSLTKKQTRSGRAFFLETLLSRVIVFDLENFLGNWIGVVNFTFRVANEVPINVQTF